MAKADILRDYYVDLRLQSTAGSEIIKEKYRKLSLKYHPDRNHGKEKEFQVKFQEISNAYTILSDPEQRSMYDESRISAGPGKYSSGQRKPNPPPKAPPGRHPSASPRESRAANQPFPPRPQSWNHNPSFHTPGYTRNTHQWSPAFGWFRDTGWKRNLGATEWANYISTFRPEAGAYIPKHPGAAPRPPLSFEHRSASNRSASPNVRPNTPAQRKGFFRPDFSPTPKATTTASQNYQERSNTKNNVKKGASRSDAGLRSFSDKEQPDAKQDGHNHGHGQADVENGPSAKDFARTSNPDSSQSGPVGQQPPTRYTPTEPSVFNWVDGLNALRWPMGYQHADESGQRQGHREHPHSEPASQQLPTPFTGAESSVSWVDELNNLQLTTPKNGCQEQEQ